MVRTGVGSSLLGPSSEVGALIGFEPGMKVSNTFGREYLSSQRSSRKSVGILKDASAASGCGRVERADMARFLTECALDRWYHDAAWADRFAGFVR